MVGKSLLAVKSTLPLVPLDNTHYLISKVKFWLNYIPQDLSGKLYDAYILPQH